MHKPSSALVSACCILAPAVIAQPAEPLALRAMEEHRKAIVSGRIEWRVHPGGDEQQSMRFVSRFATNGDRILEYRGDDDGWTNRDPQTGEGTSQFPQLYMENKDGLWHTAETTFSGSLRRPDSSDGLRDHLQDRLKDIRWVGISVESGSLEYDQGFRAVWTPSSNAIEQWSEERVGDRYLVTGRSSTGAVKTWLINPQKGWNAERITVETTALKLECVCDLEQFGDTWLPKRTEYRKNGAVSEVLVVEYASLNDPGDKASFSPADIGLEVGSQISTGVEGSFQQYWTGKDLIASPEFSKRRRAGEIDYGPTIKLKQTGLWQSPYQLTAKQILQVKMVERQLHLRHHNTYHESLWERYVREFIRRYALRDDQAEQAWRILRNCQARANEIIGRQRKERETVIGEMLEAKEEGDKGRYERLRSRLDELSAPIAKVFETDLRPRLDKLPTRAQRAAAETRESKPPTSKPAEPKQP